MRSKPETIANLSVKEYCFSKKQIHGVVEASQFKWTFTWSFHQGLLKGKNNFNTISHVLGNISLEEKHILDKVYKRVIESLEQLNTKKEEFIINELNSFDKDQP